MQSSTPSNHPFNNLVPDSSFASSVRQRCTCMSCKYDIKILANCSKTDIHGKFKCIDCYDETIRYKINQHYFKASCTCLECTKAHIRCFSCFVTNNFSNEMTGDQTKNNLQVPYISLNEMYKKSRHLYKKTMLRKILARNELYRTKHVLACLTSSKSMPSEIEVMLAYRIKKARELYSITIIQSEYRKKKFHKFISTMRNTEDRINTGEISILIPSDDED